MSRKNSGNGVTVAKSIIERYNVNPFSGLSCITDVRKTITKEDQEKSGMKKEELAQLIFSMFQHRNDLQRRKNLRKHRQSLLKRKNVRNLKELDLLIEKEAELSSYLQSDFPYRRSQSSWAGGETDISITIQKGIVSGTGCSHTVYSSNGKWSGNDVTYRFNITKNHIMKVIGGLATVYLEKEKSKLVKDCIWWEQGRGFELNQFYGFLIKGIHTECDNKEKALEKYRKIKAKAKKKVKKFDSTIWTLEKIHNQFGFCRAGIRNFISQNNITVNELTGKELRKIVIANKEINCRRYRSGLKKLGINLNCK